jgi:hypothetical protein
VHGNPNYQWFNGLIESKHSAINAKCETTKTRNKMAGEKIKEDIPRGRPRQIEHP